MSAAYNIHYVSNDSINRQKWDECITEAGNGLIYAYSFYLDHMAKHWDALILNDYEAVMPLTWNKKMGACYLYQPFLTAQLGVFGKELNAEIVDDFIDSIPDKFKLIEISLNKDNITDAVSAQTQLRNNYTLDLNSAYEQLQQQYRENTKRNIRRAVQYGCKVVTGFDFEKVVTLALEQMRNYDKVVKENVAQFRKLYQFLQQQGKTATYGIELNGKLISSSIFFFSHNRAYYILVGNHPDGKTLGASHLLIDAFIKDHAEQGLILDFEGSDIRNLAFFYSSFGARLENYPFYRVNNLPFYLKWLKK